MRSLKNLSYLVVVGFVSLTCTPNCENITGVTFDDYPYLEEGEVLIKASNIGALQNKNVFFNDMLVAKEDLEFRPDVGLIAKMPKGVTGANVSLRIQDLDCADFVSSSLNVQPSSFFANNPDYIVPAPPQIIIPIPNPPLPPSINNAWISPDNKDYCIWFAVNPVTGSPGNYVITPTDRPDPVSGVLKKTEELSVNQLACGTVTQANTRYHHNPIYGMINTSENKIQFWIDRTSKGLGVEEFEGQFINIAETPYKNDEEIGPPNCKPAPWVKTKLHMMMVVSKQTKRTMVLYQQLAQ